MILYGPDKFWGGATLSLALDSLYRECVGTGGHLGGLDVALAAGDVFELGVEFLLRLRVRGQHDQHPAGVLRRVEHPWS